MEIESEGVNTRGKSGNKNPLAFLGLKRVDVEDEEDDDTKSDDNDIDGNKKIVITSDLKIWMIKYQVIDFCRLIYSLYKIL